MCLAVYCACVCRSGIPRMDVHLLRGDADLTLLCFYSGEAATIDHEIHEANSILWQTDVLMVHASHLSCSIAGSRSRGGGSGWSS